MEKEIIRVKLKTISPVHIGSSEVYEPTGFVVDTDNNVLTSFDPTDFISSLTENEKNELSDICKKGTVKSIIDLYRFMNGRKIFGKEVSLPEDFAEHYRNILSLSGNDKNIAQNLNKFVIERTAFRKHDQRPYIPGSSIKGSLRTAYLNFLTKKLNYYVNFKNIVEDPFRLIKVSDFHPIEKSKTKIYYCINRKKKELKEGKGPYQILEIIKPETEFIGTISIEKPVNNKYIKNTISGKDLLNSVKFFFKKLLNDEKEIFDLYPVFFKMPENNLPIKLGRHTGAEGVTVEGYREIKIKLKNSSKTLSESTTYWFVSDYKNPSLTSKLQPLGWSELEILSEDKFESLSDIQKDVEQLYEKEISYKRNQIEKEVQKEIEKENQKLEAQKKLVEEKNQKKELEDKIKNLPSGEKELAELSMPDIDEQKVNEIYKKLSSLPDEFKIKIAEKIKEFFIKNKKWGNPKKLSKKQAEKVKFLKGLLNEK
jgi:CRISPR-associated protein Csm5